MSDRRPWLGMTHVPPCHRYLCHGQIENVIEPVDDALDAAPVREVDHRIADRGKYVTCADDLRVTEKHDAVGVRIGCGLVIDDHGFAVEILGKFDEFVEVGIRRQRHRGKRRLIRRPACSS